jgi:hypothetical protein
MQKTMILPVCLGILLVGIVMVPGVFAESAYTMSTYVHPDQKYSIQHPSTWSVEEWDDLLGGGVIFTDSEDWTIEVEIWNLGSIPFIDLQSEQLRFSGTITGERLACTLPNDMGYVCRDLEPTGEHGFVTLSSGEVVHSVSYTAVREYTGGHTVGITSTAFDFLCCTNHIYQIIFHIDTTNPANIPNETIFQIKQDMLESFTFLPAAASEPDPKSTQLTSGGCGQGTILVDGVCQLAPQESNDGCGQGTVMVNGVCQLAKTGSPFNILSGSTIEPLYIAIGAVAVGGGIVGVIFAVRKGSSGTSTPKPARQDLDDYEEQYLRRQGQRPTRKPAETRQTSSSCSSCGKPLKPTAKFCGKCGSKQ